MVYPSMGREFPPKAKAEESIESKETRQEIDKLKNFIYDLMGDFIDGNKIEAIASKAPEKLIDLLMEYWNEPASFENFMEIFLPYGDPKKIKLFEKENPLNLSEIDENDPLYEVVRSYYLGKLPILLRQKWEDWLDDKEKTLEDIKTATEQKNSGLIVGFNTSPMDIVVKDDYWNGNVSYIRKSNSADVFGGTDKDVVSGAKSWYSLNYNNLYSDKNPEYLYIVEGSRSDFDNKERLYDEARGAVYCNRDLPIRFKIKLSPELIKQLKLNFNSYKNIN